MSNKIKTFDNELEKAVFYMKCKKDVVYFIENCCMTPEAGGDELVTLYDPQKRVVETFIKHNYLVILKSRQTGASYLSQCLCAWLVIFYTNYIIGIISRSGKEASSFVRKCLTIIDKIPYDFIRPDSFPERNAQSFTLPNNSRVVSQAVSAVSPENIFRGESVYLLILDECAFIKYIDIAWTAVAPSLSKTHQVAKQKNIPYGNIVLSTPNGVSGKGEWFYKRWKDAITGDDDLYKPCKIHWKEIPDYVNDPTWYEKQKKILNNDPLRIKQELELVFVSSGDSIWSDEIQEKLNMIEDNEHTSIIHYKEGGTFKLFKKDDFNNKFYFIGVDCASASSTDYSTVQVLDYETMEQIAEFKGKMEPKIFAKIVKKISWMFLNNIIIVENSGGYGLTVLNELQFDEDKDYSIYGEYKYTGVGKKRAKKFISGISTNSKTRPLIIEALYNYVTEHIECINSKALAMELLSLENKNNKIQASTGFNDDLSMAIAFCLYVRSYDVDFYMGLIDSNKEYRKNKDKDPGNDFVEELVTEVNSYDPFNQQFDEKYYDKIFDKDKYITDNTISTEEEIFDSNIFIQDI